MSDLALYQRVRAAGMPPSPRVPPYFEQIVHCVSLDVPFREAVLSAVEDPYDDHEEEDDA